MSKRDHAVQDEPQVVIPVSAGFPLGVRISFVASIILALAVLGLVVAVSAANHVWPSGDSLHVKL